MTAPRKTLIVNADDLGRTPGLDRGILEAHAHGIVSSATLMVAYPGLADTVEAVRDHPRLGIGLHVALTGGPSVLPAAAIPSLVDADGRLPRTPDGLAGARPDDVRAEVRAQFERFCLALDRPPTHLDGHHHCHRQEIVLEAVVELALEHQLPVRTASPEVGRRLARDGVVTTDRFVNRFYDEDARLEVLLEILDRLEDGVTEVMCHPGRVDTRLRLGSSYTDVREREIEILTHPDVRSALDDRDIRLTHFGNLDG